MSVLTVDLVPTQDAVTRAVEIPPLLHSDAPALALAEFDRVVSVLESLSGDDWEQPTYCTEWNVREMMAHLAGAVAGFASWGEFFRQYVTNPYTRSEVQQIDGVNRRQLEDRADSTPDELSEEFRQAGPKAIRVRHNIPWPLRNIPLLKSEPVSEPGLNYLLDVIYPRDWWMHRYDICAATGKEMAVYPKHDGRIVELIVRDVMHVLARSDQGDCSFVLELEGAAGGAYRFGPDPQPDTTIRLDTFDFALVSSGRITAEKALPRTTVAGDRAIAKWFVSNCEVLY